MGYTPVPLIPPVLLTDPAVVSFYFMAWAFFNMTVVPLMGVYLSSMRSQLWSFAALFTEGGSPSPNHPPRGPNGQAAPVSCPKDQVVRNATLSCNLNCYATYECVSTHRMDFLFPVGERPLHLSCQPAEDVKHRSHETGSSSLIA